VTFLVDRLADLHQHLRHLRELAPRVPDVDALRRDLSLHNDVLFSLLVVCQAVIDIAGELACRPLSWPSLSACPASATC
jgi:hypothetical protein